MIKYIKRTIKGFLGLFNIDLVFSSSVKQDKFRVQLFNSLNTDLVVDVGANVGQYSMGLFKNGFKGHVISFEPVGDVYSQLLQNSKPNAKWTIYEKCAVGSKEETIEINVSQNYESSSILNVLERSIAAEPSTSFVRKEKVKIIALSNVSELRNYKRLHLKIDVQGYEEMVLNGAIELFSLVSSIELEISLVPLYQNALSPQILISKLDEYGFEPVFYTSAFNDPVSGSIMQLDGLFVKKTMMDLVPQ